MTSIDTTEATYAPTGRDELVLLQSAHTALLAAARATVAAERRGEADPVAHLRYLLAETGQLPSAGALPARLLAGTPSPTAPEPQTPVYERTFPGRPETIAQVRRFVAEVLTGCPRAEDAVLCASELAINALMHTASGYEGGQFTVRLRVCGQVRVHLEVTDQGAHQPSVTAHGPHTPAHPHSVTAHGSAHAPHVPAQRDAALSRPADEGGLGLGIVRALVGGQPGDAGLSWDRTPDGGVTAATLTWQAPSLEAAG
ncbi:ATP-binding protein [Streptosporangium sp. NPDC051022]|uniref:ATP-binding protein n=1 Tax=Streptosporangium sp. NPDC051022 TaxID=3155752 RepID=UPI00342AEDE2